MPYRYVVTNSQRPTRFTEFAGMSDMENRIILNIGPMTNVNPVHVSTDCTLRPHANIVARDQITELLLQRRRQQLREALRDTLLQRAWAEGDLRRENL